jgi:hypothetical protein
MASSIGKHTGRVTPSARFADGGVPRLALVQRKIDHYNRQIQNARLPDTNRRDPTNRGKARRYKGKRSASEGRPYKRKNGDMKSPLQTQGRCEGSTDGAGEVVEAEDEEGEGNGFGRVRFDLEAEGAGAGRDGSEGAAGEERFQPEECFARVTVGHLF